MNIGNFGRVYGTPPLVHLAVLMVFKYLIPPGISPALVALFSAIDSMDFTGD